MEMPNDTSPEAARVQIELLRQAGPAGRFAILRSLTATAVRLAREGIRRARPDLDERGVLIEFVALHYGAELAVKLARRLEEPPA
jgi:hypothetical protein